MDGGVTATAKLHHDEAVLLLGAYAVHALDQDEKRKVIVHLAECARCHSEVSRHQHLLTFLGHPGKRHDTA